MSEVKVKLDWNGGMKFTAVNANGQLTAIDGDNKTAASPVELLLEALGACTGIDVVLILEKMRTPATQLEVTIVGNRQQTDPKYYTALRVRFDVWGDAIKPDKLARAINLSLEKYCSVFHSLRPDLKVETEYQIH
ncbi:MAG: OsmC family protein [Acidobacteria bacterium]|nr:OsmC family protein [Acidobacteriota bacterium]